jgi:hypothetical protein
MKFPNPFEAFNKTKEGFKEGVDGTTVEISGNILTTASTKKADDNISWVIFSMCVAWLFLTACVMLLISIFNISNTIMKLLAYSGLIYGLLLCMTPLYYKAIYNDAPLVSKVFKIVTIMFLCIVAPVGILLLPQCHFVEIFGNTIGYSSLRTNSPFNPLIIFKYLAAFESTDLGCFSRDNFTSRAFPEAEIDLTPLINIFSVSETNIKTEDEKFNNIFKNFMEKAIIRGEDADPNTWNCDFIFKREFDEITMHYDVVDEIKNEIRKAAIVKHQIGEYVWLYIASIVATIASINELSLG